MRLLLQDTQSGWYYQGQGAWTPDAAVAFDFQFSAGLPDFSEKLDLRNTELMIVDHPPVGPAISSFTPPPQP